MVNSAEFAKRLKKVLHYYELSAAAFAEKIKVQRSSISHLLSGRNKPSLDFVLKVLEGFKEVELYWLLNGLGSFPNTEKTIPNKTEDIAPTLFSQNLEESKLQTNKNVENENTNKTIDRITNTLENNEIERIVLFFKNGSFKEYRN